MASFKKKGPTLTLEQPSYGPTQPWLTGQSVDRGVDFDIEGPDLVDCVLCCMENVGELVVVVIVSSIGCRALKA